eukprot:scaffold44251_cov16-Prasinocladus_malaysianus.AAC.1
MLSSARQIHGITLLPFCGLAPKHGPYFCRNPSVRCADRLDGPKSCKIYTRDFWMRAANSKQITSRKQSGAAAGLQCRCLEGSSGWHNSWSHTALSLGSIAVARVHYGLKSNSSHGNVCGPNPGGGPSILMLQTICL